MAFGLGLALCAELGYFLSFREPQAFATFWPASGLYLATLAVSPPRRWPGYLAAAIAANALLELLGHGRPLWLIAAFCCANTLEAVCGAWLLQRVHRRPFHAESLADFIWLVGLAGLGAPLAGAAVGGAAATAAAGAPDALWRNIAAWWRSDAMGVLAVAPLVLTVRGQLGWRRRCGPKMWLEAVATAAMIVAASLVAFGPQLGPQRQLPAYPFVVAPPLIWCGLRFGQFGTAIGVFLASAIAVWGTTRGYGLFAHMEPNVEMQLAALHAYVTVVTITPLLFAAVIQQQTRAEDRLKQNLELLEAVMKGTTDAIFIKDLQGRYLLINEPGARMLGLSPADVIGKDDTALFDLPTARRIRNEDRRTILTAQTTTYEAVATSAGKTWYHYTTKGPYRDVQGRVIGVVGIARDISDLKRAEEVLRASEARARAVFELAGDAIIRIDERGTIESFNPAAERMFGWPAAEIVGRNVAALMPPPFSCEHDSYLATYLQTGVPKMIGTTRELVGLRRDGTAFPIEVTISEVRIGDQRTFTGIVRDVTERRQAQQALEEAKSALERRVVEHTAELVAANEQLRREMNERARAEERHRELQAQLAHAARLSSLGEMAAELAHEINQPLSAIANFVFGTLRRLTAGTISVEVIRPTLETIGREAKRAAEVVRRTKDFVRKQPPCHVPLALNALVDEALAITEYECREFQVRVHKHLAPDLPRVAGDEVQLRQAVVNLVLNALEALKSVPAENRSLTLTTEWGGGQVTLGVTDTGPGMEPAVVERIFEAFFTTKPKGLGLGLTISRSIIESHGGRLWVQSLPGQGTSFFFTLPISDKHDDSDPLSASADRVCSG
jgi:two-component system sensor kinase FixL